MKFENSKSVSLLIIIEPWCEEIEVSPGKVVSFEISEDIERLGDPFYIQYHDDHIQVYGQRSRVMKAFVDGELKFLNE